MLARRLTTILLAMPRTEALETTHIHGVAGLTGDRTALVTARPFRAPPYHLGRGVDRRGSRADAGWGAIAHHGVLFLEELPECRRHGLAVWRQPLEEGVIYI